MRIATISIAIATAAALPIAETHAQDAVTIGDRVRVTMEDGRLTGYWQGSASGTLLVSGTEDGDPSKYPLESVTALEVSRGRHSHVLAGLGIGFLAGTTAGFAASAIACQDDQCGDEATTAANYIYRVLIGASLGTTTGAVVGYLIKTDEWQSVPLDKLRISVLPVRRFLPDEALRLELRLRH